MGDEELGRVLSRHCGMTALHMGLNGITDKGMEVVGEILGALPTLCYLDLWGNRGIGAEGVFHLLRPEPYRQLKLQTLNLSRCGLDQRALPHMARYAAKGSLRHLSLANNPLGPDAGPQLADALRCGLAALDVSDCGLGPQGAAPLADALRGGLRATRPRGTSCGLAAVPCGLLGLSFNALGETGLQYALEAAAANAGGAGILEELFLRGNGRISLGAAEAASCCAHGQRFRRLDLSQNGISPDVDELLVQCLGVGGPVAERVAWPMRGDDVDREVAGTPSPAAGRRRVLIEATELADGLVIDDDIGSPPSHANTPGTLLPQSSAIAAASPLPVRFEERYFFGKQVPSMSLETSPMVRGIPMRNRRNECEAFEAFLVERGRVQRAPRPALARKRRARTLPRYTALSMRRSM